MTVPASSALILPAPGTQSIVSVVQQQYTNAIEQQVALSTSAATPGQNFIGIQIFGPVSTPALPGGTLDYRPLQQSSIPREIRNVIPGHRLAISANFVRNNYGPFGYAYGPGAGTDGCLYGWQQIRSDAADRGLAGTQGTIQIRLRVCQAGASERDLLALMYGYTITGGFSDPSWNPYGRPAPVDAGIGGDTPLIVPIEETQASAPVATARRPARTVERLPARESQPIEDPARARDIVLVPSPTRKAVQGEAIVVPSPACVADVNGKTTCN